MLKVTISELFTRIQEHGADQNSIFRFSVNFDHHLDGQTTPGPVLAEAVWYHTETDTRVAAKTTAMENLDVPVPSHVHIYTRNPRPETRNPRPETRNPKTC